ncbi:MAG: hypothetical protein ACM65K_28425 [Microcoleus sp.]
MTAVVADTHTIIWYLRETARLSQAAMTALDTALAGGYSIYVSAIADTLISPPYILMLVKEKSGKFCIHNPAQNYKVIFSSDNYEAAKMWLLEDEYERLNSRILQEV